MKERVAILVVSCDGYSDLWPIYFSCLSKFWPTCPFPVYLGSNFHNYSDPKVKMINVGVDREYSTNLLKMLNAVDEDYVILMAEDAFFSKNVDMDILNGYLDEFARKDGKFLKLIDSYPAGLDVDPNARIGVVLPGLKYRAGIGFGLWDKKFLLENIVEGQSAWQMEKSGLLAASLPSDAVYAINSKYSGKRPFFLKHGVIKGLWVRDCIPFLVQEGLQEHLTSRKVLELGPTLYLKAYSILMYVFKKTGFKWKQ